MADRKRVLLLHHDEDSLITLQWLLENQGFDTTATWDQMEASLLLQSQSFDVVVMHEHAISGNPDILFRNVQRPQTRVIIPAGSRLSPENIAALACGSAQKPAALAQAV